MINKQPVIIKNIKLQPPYKDIYKRLGYRISTTEIDENQNKNIMKSIDYSFNFCNFQASYLRLDVIKENENTVRINDLIIESKDFSNFLSNSREVFILGTTCGNEIVKLRNELTKKDFYGSVIADATGSESVESFTQWLNDYLQKIILKEGKSLTKIRYSPGYGDFALSYQKDICNMLQLDKIGIKISDTFILDPEKSVTAFIGII